MGLAQLFFLAVGLSMDAFAIAVCAGLSMRRAVIKKALIIGLYFGAFQAGMPLIGYFAAGMFADHIIAYGSWIAFALLTFLGVKMIIGSLGKKKCTDRTCADEPCSDRKCPAGKQEPALNPAVMLPLALATSIDAMAVGISFAFLQVNIAFAAALIGVTTFLIAAAGVKIGNMSGSKLGPKAEFAGGIILMLIGVHILLGHLGII